MVPEGASSCTRFFVIARYWPDDEGVFTPEQNPNCAPLIERIIASTSYNDVLDQLLYCQESDPPSAADIHYARRKLCIMARSVAFAGLNSDEKERDAGNPSAWWRWWVIGGAHPGVEAVWPDAFKVESQLGSLVEKTSSGGREAYRPREGFAGASWNWMDSMRISDCGRELQPLDENGTPILDNGLPIIFTIESIEQAWKTYSYSLIVDPDRGTRCQIPKPCNEPDETWSPMERRHGVWCDAYLMNHMMPSDLDVGEALDAAVFSPEQHAECYRGEFAEQDLTVLTARQSARMAAKTVELALKQFDLDSRQCTLLTDIASDRLDLINRAHGIAKDYNEGYGLAKRVVGMVGTATPAIIEGAAAAIAGTALSATGVGGIIVAGIAVVTELADLIGGWTKKAEERKRKIELLGQHLTNNEKGLACWTAATEKLESIELQIEGIKQSLLGVSGALVQRANRIRELGAILDDAIAAWEREEPRRLPDARHNYWVDEEITQFKARFAWAKRLTYLALRALEYEVQQSTGLRGDVLDAVHPDQLENVLRDLEREQATRGINGNRPEDKIVVLSLRDDLLEYPPRDDNATAAERQLTPAGEFAERLNDRANAIYDNEGNYLGVGISFTVRPVGPLHYRCAERTWSANASIQGDLLGQTTPELPVFLLKRNTFQSQWCNGRGDESEMQVVSLTPSVNLFKETTEPAGPGEVEGYSWAYINAWLNVRRSDFYSEKYIDGATDELAGRGLYGDYVLLFPWYGLLEHDSFDLRQVEDILLRFDYLSVSNGSSTLGDPPPGYDEGNLYPQASVEDLTIKAGANRVRMSWRNPNVPSLERVVAKRSSEGPPAYEDNSTIVYECESTSCHRLAAVVDRGLEAGTTYYFGIFAIADGAELASIGASVVPLAAPVASALTIWDAPDVVLVSWTNPSFEGFAGTWLVRNADHIPLDEDDGLLVDAADDTFEGAHFRAADDGGLIGDTFYYRVFTVDDFDVFTGGPSGIGHFDLAPPTGVSATSDESGNVTVTWTPPYWWEGDTGEIVVRRAAGTTPPADETAGEAVGSALNPTSPLVDPNPIPADTTYTYAVFACSRTMCSASSDTATSTAASDDFEAGLTLWSQVTGTDGFDWTWGSGTTPTSNTGPEGGADGSTYYYFAEATGNASSSAILEITQPIDMTGFTDGKLSFYYHMWGADTGTLYLEVSSEPGYWDPLWSKTGDQGHVWFAETISLTEGAGESFNLRFRVETTSGDVGDIAIDEIRFRAWE